MPLGVAMRVTATFESATGGALRQTKDDIRPRRNWSLVLVRKLLVLLHLEKGATFCLPDDLKPPNKPSQASSVFENAVMFAYSRHPRTANRDGSSDNE